jgi:hypothetical protein
MRWAVAFLAVSAAWMAGCGPNCQDACLRVYGEAECNKSTPGQDWDDAYKACVIECNNALKYPGELGGYDPDERNTSGESINLENEQQAAAWMDCVLETSCERIEDGYCPI